MSDWHPPDPLPASAPGRIRGALSGSLLFEQPEHRAEAEAVRHFLSGDGPVALEIGVDHATVFIDHARRYPSWRWLGLEIRKRKVARARPHVPANGWLWAADARTVVHAVLPDHCLSRVDILFPTPVIHAHHLLITDRFVTDLRRVMTPDGVLTVATDVEGMHHWAHTCLHAWRDAVAPPRGPVRSRRERVCQRDGRRVWWSHWCPPRPDSVP